MPSRKAKNIVFGRNWTDAKVNPEKTRQAYPTNRAAPADPGAIRQPGPEELAGLNHPQLPMESLVAGAGLSRLCPTRTVVRLDLEASTGTSWLTVRPACFSAHLPGLGVCTLYPRQCLACPDAHSLGREVWSFTSGGFCQHDD